MIDFEKISLQDFAGFVSEELKKRGIDVILVGVHVLLFIPKIVISLMISIISLMLI
jgi:hypothetical protein